MARPSQWLKALIKPLLKTDVPLTIRLAAGQTAKAIVVETSAGAEVFSVSAAGALTPAAGSDLADDVFKVHDPVDDTKKVRLDAGAVTAGQTRVLAAPDYDGDLATLAGTETLTNKTLTAPKVGTSIKDTNGNELLKVTATGAAVNELTLANAAADGAPKLSATGDDTHIGISLAPKGAQGRVLIESELLIKQTASALNTASNLAYTAAQVTGGLILRDPNGGARADTVPTAADLVADLPGAVAGQSFRFIIRNTADAAETITVTTAAGATLSGTMTIAQNNQREFLAVLTNVGAGTEAYTVYSLGTSVW
jgi:hypothetical protein